MPEYIATLTQDTGASLLLRVSANNYVHYSLDGVVWQPLNTQTSTSTDDEETPTTPESRHLISKTLDCGAASGAVTHTLDLREGGITEYVKIINYSTVDTVNIVIPDIDVAQDTIYTSTLWIDTTEGNKELTLSMDAEFCSGAHNQLFSGYSNILHIGVTKMGITQLPNGKSFVTVLGYWGA